MMLFYIITLLYGSNALHDMKTMNNVLDANVMLNTTNMANVMLNTTNMDTNAGCETFYGQDIRAGTFAHIHIDGQWSVDTNSDAECRSQCFDHLDCTGWVRQPSTGNCWLTKQAGLILWDNENDRNGGLRCDIILAEQGSNRCPSGTVNVGQDECLHAVEMLVPNHPVSGVRSTLIGVDPSQWTHSNGWNHVPPGCSAMTRGDSAAHWNVNPNGVNTGGFSLLCRHKHYVVKGNSLRTSCAENNQDCTTQLSSTSSVHPVRCCADVATTGYTKRASCSVWGSSPQGCPKLNWEEANEVCKAAEGRLCTKTEMEDSCTGSTGCGFDDLLVWTDRPELKHYVAKGNSLRTGCVENNQDCTTQLASATSLHPVRCCADVATSGYIKRESCSVWGSTPQGCLKLNWEEANEVCKAAEGRLCTKTEMEASCTATTGCGFDDMLVWTVT